MKSGIRYQASGFRLQGFELSPCMTCKPLDGYGSFSAGSTVVAAEMVRHYLMPETCSLIPYSAFIS
jgi:hypothetical protein